ncbi:hypothetical protein EJ03DRAFT_176745 [Teratosphaeria nubilosa]|uniref:Uncharacterized protein n=1 Tax=Teratosphaeria nubilosa TaxID=161662 RepID=A0A6G1L0Q0_9PEZI|nr:hypothetical protein EJ03DRAFT_176745 [Teratosphaeria nubilosa]
MSNNDCAPSHLNQPRGLMKSYQELRISPQPTKRVRDTYLDINGQLVGKDLWLRRRTEEVVAPQNYGKISPLEVAGEEWEAKVRLGGNYTDSQFEEVKGKEAVIDVLGKLAPGVSLDELAPFADLLTERQAWSVSNYPIGDMSIVLDSVTQVSDKTPSSDTSAFCHGVGEVELMAEVVGGGNEAKHMGRKKAQAEVLRARLDEFIEANAELFPAKYGGGGKVAGKLSAYLEWKGKVQGGEEKME